MGATRSGDIHGRGRGPAGSTRPGGLPAIRVTAPGAMQLTLMPCAAPAVARLRVSPINPPLAVAYERFSGRPNSPDEVVMTMRP
jgi:hypothetical protein